MQIRLRHIRLGKLSDDIQKLLEVTEEALYVGLEKAVPGNHVSDISAAIEAYVKPYGYGIVEEFTGHGIGRDLHEEPFVPNFGKAGLGPILKPGMTFCVEPMINLGTKHVLVLRIIGQPLRPITNQVHILST
jgi:methionyl aminopeptidase